MKTLLIALTIAALTGCSGNQTKKVDTDLTNIKPSNPQGEVKSLMEKHLKDPASAMYRFKELDTVTCRSLGFFGKPNKVYSIDFAVNGKNSFGGYTGYKSMRAFFDSGKALDYSVSEKGFISNACPNISLAN